MAQCSSPRSAHQLADSGGSGYHVDLSVPLRFFQRIMDGMLEGISGATAIMDDILIAAPDVKTHDAILCKITEKVTSYNLRLNFKKCHIRQS